jgi:putative flippase GtrA
LATLIDICVLLLLVKGFHFPNARSAMVGVAVGATFTFLANREWAFRHHGSTLRTQVAKFASATALGMGAHGAVVYVLADHLGVPVVLAKLAADVAVFSVGQLLLLRYVVFPPAHERSP